MALPLSVIPAFSAMYLLGFSLNMVTLLALSLVVGILVDDAIVEIENIVRHLRMGKTPYQAAMEAADEIGLAVIATTFTLIAVFLPTAFMSGVPGKFFKQFGWTAAIAVFVLAGGRAHADADDGGLHAQAARRSARRRPRWMHDLHALGAAGACGTARRRSVAATLFFVGSLALIPLLPTGFIPPDDRSQTQVYVELPPGATLDADHGRGRAGAPAASMKIRHVKQRLHHDRRRQRPAATRSRSRRAPRRARPR